MSERSPVYLGLLDALFSDYVNHVGELNVTDIERRLEARFGLQHPEQLARMKADLHWWIEHHQHASN